MTTGELYIPFNIHSVGGKTEAEVDDMGASDTLLCYGGGIEYS